jgi:hypothetical protein
VKRPHRRYRSRWFVLAAVVVAVGLVVSGVRVWNAGGTHDDLGATAVASASSSAAGYAPGDALSTARGQDRARGWVSGAETVGAWIELSWSKPVTIRRVSLERNALTHPGMLAGYLSFGDGSDVQVTLSTTGPITVVPVTARSVDRLRFTVTRVADGASSVLLQRLRVEDAVQRGDVGVGQDEDGNVAGLATVSTPDETGGDLGALNDGNASKRLPGRSWTSRQTPAWIKLRWSKPRELATVALSGTAADAQIRGGTITFADGSSVQFGAVLADPARPTVVSFMPHVTSSITLRFDQAPGAAPLALSELSAYERSAPALEFAGSTQASTPLPRPAACILPEARPSDSTGLVVGCPTVGATVGSSVSLRLAVGPSYEAVEATVWSADTKAIGVPTRVEAAVDGSVSTTLDLATVPAGPFVVQLRAFAPGRSQRTLLLQLFRDGDQVASDPAPTVLRGRSLVFDDEFHDPVSVSSTGADADYAAAKPEWNGVSQFGDAPFADPVSTPAQAPSTIGGQYLDLSVNPADQGGYTGGLVASARPGGSGFSAQYGYFEARMMAPASPGTWPAFWTLPTSSLVKPQPVGAEVDAVELYGHDPLGACHSTHEYVNGKAAGGIAQCGKRWTSSREASEFHVYGVAVAPTLISFYIDDVLVATAPQISGGDQPLFFLLDLALGGGWPVDLSRVQGRAHLYVDYVRVYV